MDAVADLLRLNGLNSPAGLDAVPLLLPGGDALNRLGTSGSLPLQNPMLDQSAAMLPLLSATTQLLSMLVALLAPAQGQQNGTSPLGNNTLNGGASPNGGTSPNGVNAAPPTYDNRGDQGAAKGNAGVWGPKDQEMLDKAITSSSVADPSKYDKLFSQFGQSTEGNCASTAVIKAALDKYDGKVFQSVQKTGTGYTVQMQDGKSVQISQTELQSAAKAAKFKGEANEVKSMAILMFAVIAKRGSSEGMGSFDSMLKNLDNGFSCKTAAKLLGLGNKIRNVSVGEAGQKDGVVAYSGKHAVYVDQGKTDHYGSAKGFDGTDTNGGRLSGAFEFV